MTAPWTPPGAFRLNGDRVWINYHRNIYQAVTYNVDAWNAKPEASTLDGYKATTRALQETIAHALENYLEVRAVGGTWSWAPVAATDGILLNTRPLNYRFRIGPQYVDPASGQNPSNLFLLQCGNSIADINTYLRTYDRALKTSGASNGQTIAGALSTGTHGAALKVGAVPDYVHGLHIVTGPGESFWIQRTKPVMTPPFAGLLDATPITDDAVFDAALVSFGSFGVIHGVLIETEPLYYLHAFRKKLALTPGLWTALTSLQWGHGNLPGWTGQDPDHFQAVFNPHEVKAGLPPHAHFTVMYRSPTKPPGSKPPWKVKGAGAGDNALEIMAALTDLVPEVVPAAMTRAMRDQYPDYDNVGGTHGEIFGDTNTRGRTLSAGMAIPVASVQRAVAIAVDVIQRADAPALVAVRYVRASSGTLSFTNLPGQQQVCVMEIDGPWSHRTKAACEQIWAKLDAEPIPYTFHWGKVNNLTEQRVRAQYDPARIAAWRAVRKQLFASNPRLGDRVFANRFLRQLNLHQA